MENLVCVCVCKVFHHHLDVAWQRACCCCWRRRCGSVNTTHFIPDVKRTIFASKHKKKRKGNSQQWQTRHKPTKCDFSIQWTHFHPILSICNGKNKFIMRSLQRNANVGPIQCFHHIIHLASGWHACVFFFLSLSPPLLSFYQSLSRSFSLLSFLMILNVKNFT